MKKLLIFATIAVLIVSTVSCKEFIYEPEIETRTPTYDTSVPSSELSPETESPKNESSKHESSKSDNSTIISSTKKDKKVENKPELSAEEYLNNSSYTIIANVKTKKYHDRNCRYVKSIKPENVIGFKSAEEAVKNVYSHCSICFK